MSSDSSDPLEPPCQGNGKTHEVDRLNDRVDSLDHALREHRAASLSAQLEADALGRRLTAARTALSAIRTSPFYRLMVKIGRWRWLEPLMHQALGLSGDSRDGQTPSTPCIAVDMTPVLPGGDNGGAKFVALGLVRQLAEMAPDWRFVLLTSGKSHDELAALDRPNVRRECVIFQDQCPSLTRTSRWTRLRMKLARFLVARVSPAVFDRLRRLDAGVSQTVSGSTLLRRIGADLYFCVFTNPNFYDPAVPVVSTVYDLQYKTYPLFFPPRELYYRDQHFNHTIRVARRLVCISDYVRRTVLHYMNDPSRVVTSYICLGKRIAKPSPQTLDRILKRLKLRQGGYLFYPANFWPHKNHAMLLTAFALHRARHPDSDLKLVFTGEPVGKMASLQQLAVPSMGLSDHVVFAGFVSDEEFAALMEGCRGVIFPSLYEGFGMPVLEAMEFGRPVACGNVTSLPEVAGDAALLFDPRRPAEIAEAIERLASDDALIEQLVAKGHARARQFNRHGRMAGEYLDIFRQVLGSRGPFVNAIDGLHTDHWTTGRLLMTYAAGEAGRVLELDMAIPRVPTGAMTVRYSHNNLQDIQELVLKPDHGVTFRRPLSPDGGFIDMEVGPLYRPGEIGLEDDGRELGFMCQRCQIVHPDDRRDDLLGEWDRRRLDPALAALEASAAEAAS